MHRDALPEADEEVTSRRLARLRRPLVADQGGDGDIEPLGDVAQRLKRRLVLVVEPLRERSGRDVEMLGNLPLRLALELAVNDVLKAFTGGHASVFAYSERRVNPAFGFRERLAV